MATTAQAILSAVSSGLALMIGGTVGGLLAGWLTIRGLYVLCAATGFAAVGLIALAVLPVATRGEPTEPVGDSPPAERLASDRATLE